MVNPQGKMYEEPPVAGLLIYSGAARRVTFSRDKRAANQQRVNAAQPHQDRLYI